MEEKFDKNNNCIYHKNSSGLEIWQEYDENNNEIKISEKEFKKIKKDKEYKEFINRPKVSRFELMDI